MDQNELLKKTPFIYHLTDKRNVESIINLKRIFSTNSLIDQSSIKDKDRYKTTRRTNHEQINLNGINIWIRDQRPLNAALDKCLTYNWTREQFIHLLNSRVFFWPNLGRLNTHFGRYATEDPIIFKINLELAIQLNSNIELSHLNSGATRPLSVYGGRAPERGPNTFLPIPIYDRGIKKLAEVTFPDSFVLPDSFFISSHPNGPWKSINI